jgi:hypothetical protein
MKEDSVNGTSRLAINGGARTIPEGAIRGWPPIDYPAHICYIGLVEALDSASLNLKTRGARADNSTNKKPDRKRQTLRKKGTQSQGSNPGDCRGSFGYDSLATVFSFGEIAFFC